MKKIATYALAVSLMMAQADLLYADNGNGKKLLKSTMESGSIKFPSKRIQSRDLAAYSEAQLKHAVGIGSFLDTTISGDLYVTGNVGIGTIAPTQNLDVKAAASSDAFIRVAGGAGPTKGGLLLGNSNGNYGELTFDNASNNLYLLQKYSSGDLLLGTNSTTNITIKNGGNVGIGTSSPEAKLHISSGAIRLDAGYSLDFGGTSTYILGGSPTNNLRMYTNDIERLRIDHYGNVNIGSNSHQTILAVNGNIQARRVKVTVLSGDWPDYVFAKDYKLKPLNEVEAFIKKNNHLPEIPSAKEMEKKGVDVGANQAMLLQKVEELTLYLIEQNKKIAALEQQVQQMKKAKKP